MKSLCPCSAYHSFISTFAFNIGRIFGQGFTKFPNTQFHNGIAGHIPAYLNLPSNMIDIGWSHSTL